MNAQDFIKHAKKKSILMPELKEGVIQNNYLSFNEIETRDLANIVVENYMKFVEVEDQDISLMRLARLNETLIEMNQGEYQMIEFSHYGNPECSRSFQDISNIVYTKLSSFLASKRLPSGKSFRLKSFNDKTKPEIQKEPFIILLRLLKNVGVFHKSISNVDVGVSGNFLTTYSSKKLSDSMGGEEWNLLNNEENRKHVKSIITKMLIELDKFELEDQS